MFLSFALMSYHPEILRGALQRRFSTGQAHGRRGWDLQEGEVSLLHGAKLCFLGAFDFPGQKWQELSPGQVAKVPSRQHFLSGQFF